MADKNRVMQSQQQRERQKEQQQPEQQQEEQQTTQNQLQQIQQDQPDSKEQALEQQQQQQHDPAPIQQLGNCSLLPHDGSKVCQQAWVCADFCGRPCVIRQLQATSGAKHPILQRKTAKQPCQQDVAGMCRVRKLGVPTPVPYHVDTQHDLVYCSNVDATPLGQQLDAAQQLDTGLQQLLVEFGRLLARMHDGGVVHGDLSSSCVLVKHKDQTLLLCDFACFINSKAPIDKAADLVVLEQQLQQAHPHLDKLFDAVLASYNKHSSQWSAVFNRLPEARNALLKHQEGGPSKKLRTG